MYFTLRLLKRCLHTSRTQNLPVVDFTFWKKRTKHDPYYDVSIYGDTPRSKVGGVYTVPMCRGGGIGPEVMDSVREVFDCAAAPIDFIIRDVNEKSSERDFQLFVLAARKCGCCIKANIERPSAEDDLHHLSRNMRLRHALKLYSNVMHLRTLPGLPSKVPHLDLIIVRMGVEGEYSLLEHEPVPNVIENLKINTEFRTERMARFAFNLAKKKNRKKVTIVYIEGVTPYIFYETCAKVAKDFPEIPYKIKSVTDCLINVMLNPSKEDVIIAESMYGGVIANVGFGLIGSNGIIPGCNYGRRYAMFEPGARSFAKSIAGKGIANPVSSMLAGVEMLRFLELDTFAELIEDAVLKSIEADECYTADIGGTATTKEFTMNVIQRLIASRPRMTICAHDKPPEIPPPPTTPTEPFDPKIHTQFNPKQASSGSSDPSNSEDSCSDSDSN